MLYVQDQPHTGYIHKVSVWQLYLLTRESETVLFIQQLTGAAQILSKWMNNQSQAAFMLLCNYTDICRDVLTLKFLWIQKIFFMLWADKWLIILI